VAKTKKRTTPEGGREGFSMETKRILWLVLFTAFFVAAGTAAAEPRFDSGCSESLLELREEMVLLRAEVNVLRAQADMLYWENKIQIGCTKAFMKVHGMKPVSIPSEGEMDLWFERRDQAKARLSREIQELEAVRKLLNVPETHAALE
jgi:hypothetical protein